jgi:hypothetical protein
MGQHRRPPKTETVGKKFQSGKDTQNIEKIHKLDQTQASDALGTNMDPQNNTT